MADPKQVTKTTETHTTITQTQGTPLPAGSAPIANTMGGKWLNTETVGIEGEVIPNATATEYWFEYGTTPNLGATTTSLSAGDGAVAIPVSATIPNADAAATYYFRLVAENKHGKVPGAVHTLQALPPIPTKTTVATTAKEDTSGWLYNILASAGLFIVLIIVIWGLIHLATLLSPWFSSLFSSKTTAPAALHVNAPANVTSGTPFNVTWSYSPTVKGTYAFLYPCNDSLHFDTTGTQGVSNTIPCGAAFTVTGSSISVTPRLSGTKALNEALTVLFVPSQGGAQAQGGATVTVNPGTQPTTPVVSTPVAHSGPADLSVVILSAVVDQSGTATVLFDVANGGTGDSGSYTFQAYLPIGTTYTYYSPSQVSLSPGSHIVNTLRFTMANPGPISIIVDPTNSVNDSNRTNNYAAQNLSMPYGYNPQTRYNNQPTPIYYGQPYVY